VQDEAIIFLRVQSAPGGVAIFKIVLTVVIFRAADARQQLVATSDESIYLLWVNLYSAFFVLYKALCFIKILFEWSENDIAINNGICK